MRYVLPGGLFLVAIGILAAGTVDQSKLSDDEVATRVEYVLELITKRQLTASEIQQATQEFLAAYNHECDAPCQDAVQVNVARVQPMLDHPGEPRDLLARQYYSRVLYFSPEQTGGIIQKLTDEVDPIVVVDTKIKRIMTRSDVLAVMNIHRFIQQGGRPINHKFSQDTVNQEIARRQNRYGRDAWRMPFRTGLAAELWAGVYQNWDKLDGEQQLQVRHYFSDKNGAATMSIETFATVLGMNMQAATEWQHAFTREQQYDRLADLQYITLMGAVARGVSEGEAFWRW